MEQFANNEITVFILQRISCQLQQKAAMQKQEIVLRQEETNSPSVFLHENTLFPSVPNEINYALDERITIALRDFPKEFKNVQWFKKVIQQLG